MRLTGENLQLANSKLGYVECFCLPHCLIFFIFTIFCVLCSLQAKILHFWPKEKYSARHKIAIKILFAQTPCLTINIHWNIRTVFRIIMHII